MITPLRISSRKQPSMIQYTAWTGGSPMYCLISARSMKAESAQVYQWELRDI